MWNKLLSSFLRRLIKQGALVVIDSDGHSRHFGETDVSPVTVTLHERSLARRLVLDPDLSLGEAYMDGTLTVAEDNIYALMELVLVNLKQHKSAWHYRWLAAQRRLWRRYSNGFGPICRRKSVMTSPSGLRASASQLPGPMWNHSRV